jgi:predicted transposase/invertase (TIGR01784 family)
LSEYLMTYAEIAEERGLQVGRQEGRQEVAVNMLNMGIPLDDVARYTQLPRTYLEEKLAEVHSPALVGAEVAEEPG